MIKQCAIIAASVLLVAALEDPAHSGPNDTSWDPPARYSQPYPHTVLFQLPKSALERKCSTILGQSGQWRGCMEKIGRLCRIYTIDRPAYNTTPRAVWRHEMGHCAGWPADHPK